ncbi:MAG: CehA/McbA family metallohydrolase [Polyangiaceae bacterium]|nr:CehA/McbA family metallohydrolase [Polyangiaceae bacterium]
MDGVSPMRAAVIGGFAFAFGLAVGVSISGYSAPRPEKDARPPPKTSAGEAFFAERLDVSTFQRGNIHTHSTESDGDRPPEEVYSWYRDHGYAFVALTDHNKRIDPDSYRHLERPGFVILPGEEVTMTVSGTPVHVNAICTKSTLGGGPMPSRKEALSQSIQKIREQGGVALINHPNFEWALTGRDLLGGRGAQLLEIWSGHPHVRTEGDAAHKSHEALWDEVLSAGEHFAGVAVDDMHHLTESAPEPASRPGRGWIEVFAREASEPALCEALRSGRLYASTGAKINRIVIDYNTISLWPEASSASVEFMGAGGEVLASRLEGKSGARTYVLRGDERYVRARVSQPDGKKAWTPAFRIAR